MSYVFRKLSQKSQGFFYSEIFSRMIKKPDDIRTDFKLPLLPRWLRDLTNLPLQRDWVLADSARDSYRVSVNFPCIPRDVGSSQLWVWHTVVPFSLEWNRMTWLRTELGRQEASHWLPVGEPPIHTPAMPSLGYWEKAQCRKRPFLSCKSMEKANPVHVFWATQTYLYTHKPAYIHSYDRIHAYLHTLLET